ncbi:MAG: response regulator [Candidatus Eisenbacteria bacterium]|uniref:histidine kinase n=1 Tax=Eiseniibacteriota bacterium TaxID=2212470 RepID=A0A956NF26_UNCEI|nr:response regulator [Candidatus Eisenbacteria bacterium]MCB9463707.1 response regulator [Candidatus Eisenbacteria bacterium]
MDLGVVLALFILLSAGSGMGWALGRWQRSGSSLDAAERDEGFPSPPGSSSPAAPSPAETSGQLQALIDSTSQFVIFSLDRGYRYTAFNQRHRQEMSKVWSAEIEIGHSILDYMTNPELRALAKQSIDRALAGETFSETNLQPDLHIHYEFFWRPIVQSDGTIAGVTAFICDVSEVRKTLSRFSIQKAALESATSSVVITNANGTIEWVNPAFCQITGYSNDEVVGQNPRILKSGKLSDEVYAEMWRTISSGGTWRGELINRRKDGSLYTEEATVTPVTDERGTITHYVGFKRDISVLKKSLEDLEATQALLKEKNRRLDEALVAARAAAKAKDAFLANMSHELRTPMNGVIGMASLLRESEPLTDLQKDHVETIRASGQTLLALISDILDFSKIESDHMVLEETSVDLHDFIEETLEALAPIAWEKRLDLCVDIDSAVPSSIVCDPIRLRQIMTNLVGNAIKFTEQGEVVVTVECLPGEDEHRLSFGVRDTGVGIPPDVIDRLFEPFCQGDSSTTRLYGGTGLGLAISQRLVGLMGGRITIQSEPSVGSLFSFDICVTPASDSLALPDPPECLRGRNAWIVDDREASRRTLSRHLESFGCDALTFDSAAAALEGLETHDPPDLVLVDLFMPEMDGLEFIGRLRRHDRLRGSSRVTPTILLHSGGPESDRRRSDAGPATAVLSKPVRRRLLLEAATMACQREGTEPRDSAPKSRPTDTERMADRHPHRILLVEDNAVNRKVALRILAHLGYEADVAVNGAEAIEACRSGSYDLVLMDVQMPVVDGLAATRAVRALPGAQPKIFAMTANAMEGDRERCLAAGMNDYIAKPVRIDDIRRAVAA